jgi:hypothetical protein
MTRLNLWRGCFAAIALTAGALSLTAMRSGDPSGQHQPIIDSDDVLAVQCTPRTVTANTTLTTNDNHCGVIVTSAATVTVPTTLGEGFEAIVWADGATATVAANTNVSVTTGLFAVVRLAHAKRWVGPVSTPGNTPG